MSFDSSIFTVTVKHGHNEPTNNGRGTRWVDDPPTQERVRVSVDFDAIAQLYGQRACQSKGRKTKQLHGLVIVRKE